MGERWRRPKFDRYEVRGLAGHWTEELGAARDGNEDEVFGRILGPSDH
jgi:hypothetical protein